ncbi:hypothetical protein B0H13DRAFT_1874351 [Mycena leptocephala]|nr:hypothetical protein B0H13DRAFT_1874351 [Mycena leptocephala]
MDDEGHRKRINITPKRSLTKISKHWSFLQKLQLKSRHLILPPSHLRGGMGGGSMGLDVGNGNDDDNFEFDETEFEDALDQIPSMAQPHSAVEAIIESVDQTWPILQEAVRSETFHTRILDDAFHFMDRLLRLLSKKHSAFKAFAHDFSEAIFICDKSDEDAVGFNNRTGTKYRGHFDLWIRDEIVELALKAHHKKSILLTSECSTLATGSNYIARKQFLDIMTSDDNHATALPANPLPDGELDLSIQAPNLPGSFDRMAFAPAAGEPSSMNWNLTMHLPLHLSSSLAPPNVHLDDARDAVNTTASDVRTVPEEADMYTILARILHWHPGKK